MGTDALSGVWLAEALSAYPGPHQSGPLSRLHYQGRRARKSSVTASPRVPEERESFMIGYRECGDFGGLETARALSSGSHNDAFWVVRLIGSSEDISLEPGCM
jgi:hypothetical protein